MLNADAARPAGLPLDETARLAGLPMYVADPPAVGAWWRGIAAALRRHGVAGVPDRLEEPPDAAALDAYWRDPRLLLSQTCGYPLVTRLAGVVQVVGAFRYTAPGCDGIHYRSWLVVRDGEPAGAELDAFHGRVAAINDWSSQSGCHALRALVAPLRPEPDGHRRFFGRLVVTGSHRASLAALRDGQADIAAIDCVSWAGFERATPALLAGLRVIGATEAVPGLPLVTAAATPAGEVAALRQALAAACADPALAGVRAALFIGGFEAASAERWAPVDAMRRAAAALDWSEA